MSGLTAEQVDNIAKENNITILSTYREGRPTRIKCNVCNHRFRVGLGSIVVNCPKCESKDEIEKILVKEEKKNKTKKKKVEKTSIFSKSSKVDFENFDE